MCILFDLFVTFAKIGLFTFGSGYAMLPIIEDICVEDKEWISHDDMMNVTIISESTPGPISINCATFVGYKKAGFLGAVMASIGMILPSFCVIYVISIFFDNILEIAVIVNELKGIRIGVGILIMDSSFRMVKMMHRTFLSYLTMISVAVFMLFVNFISLEFSLIGLILITAVVSAIVFSVNSKREEKRIPKE